MKKNLALMHDTSGKTNRIKLRVDEMVDFLAKNFPQVLETPLPENLNLTGAFFLRDIKNQAIALDKVLDEFYIANKHEDE